MSPPQDAQGGIEDTVNFSGHSEEKESDLGIGQVLDVSVRDKSTFFARHQALCGKVALPPHKTSKELHSTKPGLFVIQPKHSMKFSSHGRRILSLKRNSYNSILK